jgi:LysR family glycine cleavage system transcriptional activator
MNANDKISSQDENNSLLFMIPPLASLLAFEAIARRQSFALAASELHLTPSAVSHQMAKLERQLGLKLLERSAKGVLLTPAGQDYLRRVSGALVALSSATQEARHAGQGNYLYVHSSPSFASLWLMPRLSDFARHHPDVSLYVSASPQHSDFQLGQIDIDIRYGAPNWQHVEIEPLAIELIQPMTSPGFLKAHPMRHKQDLLHGPLIQSTVNLVQWSDWFSQHGISTRPERYEYSFDRAMMSLEAAAQGLGVALESSFLAESYLKSKRLVPVFGRTAARSIQAHFAVYPQRNANRPAVLRFLKWLYQQR